MQIEFNDISGPCHCNNCTWTGDASALNAITDFAERVTPGEICPAGQCPECGCLAHLDEDEEKDGADLECTCADRSWYGDWHDSACDYAGAPRDGMSELDEAVRCTHHKDDGRGSRGYCGAIL